MKHELRWNPELQEWYGRTSDHIVCEDAEAEMELFECDLPVLGTIWRTKKPTPGLRLSCPGRGFLPAGVHCLELQHHPDPRRF
jgi:hypothetical protein